MPMTGSTRMLRARRKDCNVKPNRRLDRKSSRGMLFENEELRMRTITINAEVEQGQHALKKLRRENEQLRREMWCLRDEYDKMEKLLRKKETDEDSDQENSDSDDNYSRTDESDEEKMAAMKKGAGEGSQQEENPDLENEENLQKSSNFGNHPNVRTFDGLSVIDEQTEETQTTEYGTLSRGNSANRTFNPSGQIYDEACAAVPEFSHYGYATDPYAGKPPQRKKSGGCLYENGGAYGSDWNLGQCDIYGARPPSPYPYNGTLRPSYQKRFQVLQDLPLVPQTPVSAIGENGWIFPDPSKMTELPGYGDYVNETSSDYVQPKPPDLEMCPVLPPQDFGYHLIQDRAGPDVFVTDGYPHPRTEGLQPKPIPSLKENVVAEDEGVINNVEAEIDRIEITETSEKDPKNQKMTTLTKSFVSPSGSEPARIPGELEETHDGNKLTMDEANDKNDNEIPKHVQRLVSCQNPNGQHVRETIETDGLSKIASTDEMPSGGGCGVGGGGEKLASSKYQTKLTVTLKTPKTEIRAPKKVSTPVPPKTFQPNLRYGIKPEYGMNQRFQTFPSPGFHQPNARVPCANGRDLPVNHYAGVRVAGTGLSGSLPKLPDSSSSSHVKTEIGFTSSNIPVHDLGKRLDVLPDEESLPVPVAQPLVKPVKIPPAPPPRTSSCPKTIIPPSPLGVTALHQRNYRKGKPLQIQDSLEQQSEPIIHNPLLLSQPIATSSPTISFKGANYGMNSSENLYGARFRKQSYNDESSLEDFSRQKSKLRDDLNRDEVPKLNKSVSSPSFGSFRTLRRKQSEALASSVENILAQRIPEVMTIPEKPEKKSSKGHSTQQHQQQNNVSVSSSSGLDSPVKGDRRKRRVSIQFKKKQPQLESKRQDDEGRGKDSTDGRRDSSAQGILSVKGSDRHKTKCKNDETDATTSERERTNSVSSRTSSVAAGSTRRKFSVSSNRTYLNEEKIPWCGCWGNGCV